MTKAQGVATESKTASYRGKKTWHQFYLGSLASDFCFVHVTEEKKTVKNDPLFLPDPSRRPELAQVIQTSDTFFHGEISDPL